MPYDTHTGQWTGNVGGATDSASNDAAGSEQPLQQVTQGAQQVAQQAQQSVGQVTNQATQQAKSQLSTQKDRAADSLGSVASALRQSGQQLQQNGQAPVAQVINKGADTADQLAEYLRQRDVNQLMGEFEDFARKQTPLFLAGAFALGVMAARFLKSSSTNTASSSYGNYPGNGYTPHYAGGAYGSPGTYAPTNAYGGSGYTDHSNGVGESDYDVSPALGESASGSTGSYTSTGPTPNSEA